MPFVVTENCIKCKYTDCVEVCPVDCFHEGPNFLVIDPDECIDCAVCIPECPVEAIRALTHGEGAHKTLDTSGASEARAAAVRAARTWGTACYVGERGQVTLDVSPDLLRRQITLVGSWTFSTQGQADCAEFVADHGIAVDELFTHRWRLDQAEEAYRLFDTQTSGKGVILPA